MSLTNDVRRVAECAARKAKELAERAEATGNASLAYQARQELYNGEYEIGKLLQSSIEEAKRGRHSSAIDPLYLQLPEWSADYREASALSEAIVKETKEQITAVRDKLVGPMHRGVW